MTLSDFGESLTIMDISIQLALALVPSSALGIEREKRNRPAGMRTHVMVCLGATLISLIEQQTIANIVLLSSSQINVSVGRLTAGVVFGIGFLGAGTIVMADRKVTGLTTAASLWCTACLGIAIGAGFIFVPILFSVVMMIVLKLMQKIVVVPTYKKLLIQYVHRKETIDYINSFFEEHSIKVLDVDFHTEQTDSNKIYTNVYSLSIPGKVNYVQIIETLSEAENILAVETRNG